MTEHIVQLIAPIYSAICAAFPEFNVIALLSIGRLSYESRLSIIYPVSLNHINLLILVIHILWFGRRQKFKSVIIPNLKIFLLFCAWLTVSSILFSNYPDYALEKLIGIAVLPILSIYLMKIRILQIGNSSIQKLLVSLIVVTTILGGLGCVMWVRDPGLYRLAVLGGGPIGLGRMTGMGLIVLVMILLTPESVTTWGRNIIIVMITILLTALLLTLTKGPLVSLT
ncbi:MAG: hypothetical protein ACE5D7_02465, partial [Fidelibacterota bacterium]